MSFSGQNIGLLKPLAVGSFFSFSVRVSSMLNTFHSFFAISMFSEYYVNLPTATKYAKVKTIERKPDRHSTSLPTTYLGQRRF